MKTRNIIMLAVGIAIFIGAAVVFIVTMATRTEAGFLHEDKRWRGGPLQPEAIPVPVSCRGYVPERDEDCERVRDAVERINDRLDFEALRYDPGGAIEVIVGAPAESGWDDPGGVAELHWHEDRFTACDVRTINTGTAEILDMTIEHELGHCLGLAHDESETSIMRRVQRPVPMGVFPPRISDHDRALLRTAYAP